jgi:glutamine amidotransferase
VRLTPVDADGKRLVVPHMGWNDVAFRDGFLGLPDEEWRFYFVHSYAVPAASESTRGVTDHGGAFASVVQQGSVVGAQFHPEKSHRFGMRFLEAWIATC